MKTKHILIIDDDIQISDVLKQVIVHNTPHHIDQVYSAPEAIKALNHHSYDLLLMDYAMPNTNGYELLQEIKNQQLHSHPPIIESSTFSVEWLKQQFSGEKIRAFFDKDQIFTAKGQKQFLDIVNE